jgi:hypothetical protein
MSGSHPRMNIRFGLYALMGILSFRRRAARAAEAARGASTGGANGDQLRWTETAWGQKFMKTTTLALALVCSASIALADIKISTKSTSGGRSVTSTTYVKGGRQRIEGLGFTIIYQCDLKRMIQLNDKSRSYLITPLESAGAAKAASTQKSGANARRGGVITYTTTSTDAGERKELLGMKARRIKSKIVVEASEGACTNMNMEMETDGWYVDLPAGQGCQAGATSGFPLEQSDCVDEVRYKTEGPANTGYPVMTTTIIKFNMGGDAAIPPSTSTQEVTDISTTTLDPSLFDIPAGYKEVKSMQEMGSPY